MRQVNQTFIEDAKIRIIKSKRKTVVLCVREGEIIVRAPLQMSDGEIFGIVRKHSEWIQNRLSQSEKKLALSDGSKIELFSKSYMIQTGRANFQGNVLFLPQEGREEALIKILKKISFEQMSLLTARVADEWGFRYEKVRISSARTRWGSCNRKGTISYSFRVAFLPIETCEYIAVHELCHTRHFDHSKEFWNLVESVLPDWKKRKAVLKESPAMAFL